jgi:hypothetical protein
MLYKTFKSANNQIMTIAQALILRSDLQKNIAQLESRLLLNAQVQEGLKPNEKPEELFSKLEKYLGPVSGYSLCN